MHTHPALHLPWRVLVGTVGTLVVLAGFAMMVLPGPGLASVILGLVIFSTEFRWAQRVVRPARVLFMRAEQYGMRLKEDVFRRFRQRRAERRALTGTPPHE
ncbi:PGPGW domain-containing protein [Nocardiopsis sp. CT-R113]|uniref:PGPGW domain-containing protein n=1 Tax=Nocardiopsis codii TaxID=3065942 RepID=A0ABU7K3N8_9ACTN|nr:PGPGW domain-containing protein [Nocardiopsis sp. CT-R113]MEE2036855.1 PGPGW domain-containing protein [Nocardiopsis sp. CT-R113]